MADCWICHEPVNLDKDTCWPVEGKIGVGHQPVATDSPTHSHCIGQAIGLRGPGGQTISGYQKGPERPQHPIGGLIHTK